MYLFKAIFRLHIIGALLFLVFCWMGCDEAGICTRGNRNVETQRISVPAFEGIDLQIAGDVYLRQGAEQVVEVRGESNLIDRLDRDVNNGIWDIDFRGCVNSREKFEVFITVPHLDYVKLSGAGTILTENRFDVNDMEVILSGSGKIIMDMDAHEVFTKLSGSGTISLDMTAREVVSTISGSGNLELFGGGEVHNLKISGSGNVYAFDFATRETIVLISGSGNAEVYVDEHLDVRISGSGDVYYIGHPILDVSITGSGRVINAN